MTTPDPFALFDTFSDEDLASIGITRDQITPENMGSLIEKLSESAMETWFREEKALDELVDGASAVIDGFPGDRTKQFAMFYGSQLQAMENDLDKLEPMHVLRLFLFAVYRLAESRRAIIIEDGGHRSR